MKIPLSDKKDIKIFILYLMRHIGYPLDFTSISDIVIQDGIVGFFDFADCFTELIDAGSIDCDKSCGDTQYSVSERGLAISELENSIFPGIREKSLTSALRHLSFKKRGAALKTIPEELEDGRYRIRCLIKENGENVLDVSVIVDTEKQVERIVNNFNERPEIAFRGILALLSGDVNYIFET